jgi:hypothetical protein
VEAKSPIERGAVACEVRKEVDDRIDDCTMAPPSTSGGRG